MPIYKETVITRPHEAGRTNHLRMQSVCNYFEDVAGYHADLLGCGIETLLEQNLTWVLAKMRFTFHRLPFTGTPLHLATWPVSMERTQFRRDFTVTSDEGERLVSATTMWVIINLATRRIEKMPSWAKGLVPNNPPHALEDADIRLPVITEGVLGPVFPVRLADIDQNNHVNNVRYVDFGLEAAAVWLERTGQQERTITGIDIIFRAESVLGDVIATSTCVHPSNANALLHSFTRQQNGQELARVCTYLR